MVLTNKSTGKTCWFQTDDGDTNKWNGKAIPVPHKVTDHSFWLKTTSAAGIECVACHDNGPFMNSRWMFHAFDGLANKDQLRDKPGNPYYNFEKTKFEPPGFTDWFPVKFANAGKTGLGANGKSCTTCHKIAAKQASKNMPFGIAIFQTRDKWNDFTTGQQFPLAANDTGKGFPIAFWMPDGHGLADKAAWDAIYNKHIIFLRACLDARGAKAIDVKDTGVEGCVGFIPKDPPPPAPAPGGVRTGVSSGTAQISATIDGAPLCQSSIPSPGTTCTIDPMSPGQLLQVQWSIDQSVFDGCFVQAARFPPGVQVSPGIGFAATSMATYWGADESPQNIGSLVVPGDYEFAIYCDVDNTTSLTVHVNGPPASRLRLQALVNDAAQPAAVFPLRNAGEVSAVTTPAPSGSTVNILWTADNVAGTCRLTKTVSGTETEVSTNLYGYLEKELGGTSGDFLYKLTCTGLDPVMVTVHVGP
jgi:hypothetical protein